MFSDGYRNSIFYFELKATTRAEILILTSYKKINGIVTKICEKKSGGVIIADKNNAATTKCRL